NGIKVHQGPASSGGPGQDLIIGVLPAGEVVDRACVDYVDVETNPDGYQRPLQQSRLKDVASYVRTDDQAVLPTAVLVSVRNENAVKFTPSSSNGEAGEVGMVEIAKDVPLWVVDGQHRLFGIRAAMEAAEEDVRQGSHGAAEVLEAL